MTGGGKKKGSGEVAGLARLLTQLVPKGAMDGREGCRRQDSRGRGGCQNRGCDGSRSTLDTGEDEVGRLYRAGAMAVGVRRLRESSVDVMQEGSLEAQRLNWAAPGTRRGDFPTGTGTAGGRTYRACTRYCGSMGR